MNTFSLRLMHRPNLHAAPPSGFVILGDSPPQWLRVLLPGSCGDASDGYGSWRFFVLPRAPSDNRPVGLLCLPSAAATSRAAAASCIAAGSRIAAIKPPAGTIPVVRRGGRKGEPSDGIWLPTDSHWYPDLPEQTFAPLLPQGLVCVWMASTGLVGFEPHDALAVHDLVSVVRPVAESPGWQSPPQPVALPQRLSGLCLAQPPGLESVFGDAGQSIGNQSNDVDQLPGDSLGGQIRSSFLKLMQQLGVGPSQSDNPHETSEASAKPSWLSSKLSGMLQSQREQQLGKLIELFGRDPDQALQYALPIGGDAAYRGLAPPSGALPSQRPDFSLGGLRGGGPADFWDIGHVMRHRLNQAYREQANRELAMGRHRRAAYIYAHLLADFSSAAATLEQGRFYAEAAALYQHKLNRMEDAARCLSASGQFSAAAEIYQQRNDFVSAAEVWQQAGDDDRASELFQQAVQFQIANQKPILAAELLDTRLNDRPAAIELLLQQWPGGVEPVRAIGQAFVWMGENGEHQRTREVLQQVIANPPHQDMLAVATVTGELAARYPELSIRCDAEDACRVAIATELSSAPAIEVRERMTQLRKLGPDDTNLLRDVTRFLTQQPQAPQPAPAARHPLEGLEYLGRFELPTAGRYLHMQMIRGELLAIATDQFKLRAIRVADLATPSPRQTDCQLQLGQPLSPTICCAVHTVLDGEQTRVELYFCGTRPVHFRADKLPSPFQQSPWWLSTPLALSGIGDNACVATDQTGGVWTLATGAEGLVLREMRPPGKDIRSFAMVDPAMVASTEQQSSQPAFNLQAAHQRQPQHLQLTCVGNTPFAVVNYLLCDLQKGRPRVLESLGGSVLAVCPSLPHTRRRIAIAHTDGVDVYWLDHMGQRLQTIERGASHHHVAFLHGAHLAAIADDMLTIYRIRSDVVKKIRQIKLRASRVLALLSISTACIGVAYDDGSVDRYKAV